MTVLIGLLGPAGSGKSSVAQHLCDRYGAKRYSFAKQLKELARLTLDFSDAQVFGTQQEKETVDTRYGFSPRWFLQRLGTEGCRKIFGPNVWVEACFRQIGLDAPEVAVIDDVRFSNEARQIREAGWVRDGHVIRLLPPPGRETTEVHSTHASEVEWREANVDFEVAPVDRGLPELYRLVDDVCATMRLFPVRREVSI